VKNYVPVTDAMLQDGSPLGNDPAPIVHNGVLYVNNAAQVLQALDAKTGELIWENRYGTTRVRRP